MFDLDVNVEYREDIRMLTNQLFEVEMAEEKGGDEDG